MDSSLFLQLIRLVCLRLPYISPPLLEPLANSPTFPLFDDDDDK